LKEFALPENHLLDATVLKFIQDAFISLCHQLFCDPSSHSIF